MKPSLSASRANLTPSRSKPTDKKNTTIPAWDTKGRMNQLQAQLDETGEEGKNMYCFIERKLE
jgi:hypothetical protein